MSVSNVTTEYYIPNVRSTYVHMYSTIHSYLYVDMWENQGVLHRGADAPADGMSTVRGHCSLYVVLRTGVQYLIVVLFRQIKTGGILGSISLVDLLSVSAVCTVRHPVSPPGKREKETKSQKM
jgi:hypothetical protein